MESKKGGIKCNNIKIQKMINFEILQKKPEKNII